LKCISGILTILRCAHCFAELTETEFKQTIAANSEWLADLGYNVVSLQLADKRCSVACPTHEWTVQQV